MNGLPRRHCEWCGDPTPAAWYYPTDNLDLADMPEPDQIVVAYYTDESGSERGPVISVPITSSGAHLDAAGKSIYQPITRWCAIAGE